jgi:hypothetical protein
MRQKALVGLLVALFLVAATPPSHAVSWRVQMPETAVLARLAVLSFRGEVVQITYTAATFPGGGQLPFTEVQFRVEEAYSGCRTGDLITIRQLGGPIPGAGGDRLVVSDIPSYRLGEHYTVFSGDLRHAFAGTLWGGESRLRLVLPPTAEEWLVLDYQGHPLVRRADGRLAAQRDWRCLLDSERRDRCGSWTFKGVAAAPADVRTASAAWLKDRAFDNLVHDARRGLPPPPQPVQTVSGDRKLYAAYLVSLFGPAKSTEK